MADSSHPALKPQQNLPDKLQYQVALVFLCSILIVSVVNFIDDFANRRTSEVIVNALLFVFAAASLLYLTPARLRPGFYTTVALVLLFNVFFLIGTGAASGGALMWLFFVPPMAFYFLGLRIGGYMLGAVYIAVLVLALVMWKQHPAAFDGQLIARFSMAFVLLSLMAGAVEYSRAKYVARYEHNKAELDETRAQLNLLQRETYRTDEHLPVCAGCKSVRTDKGEWQDASEYMAMRTGQNVTHTMCSDCSREWYPDISNDLGDTPQ